MYKVFFVANLILFCSCHQNLDKAQQHKIAEPEQDSLFFSQIRDILLTAKSSNLVLDTATFEIDSIPIRLIQGDLFNTRQHCFMLDIAPFSDDFETGLYMFFTLKQQKLDTIAILGKPFYHYSGEVLMDVNGDGKKDLVVESYGQTGTGEKNLNAVYLYKMEQDTLTYLTGLGLNPHFYPETQLVTCYYNPDGEWSAEKYKIVQDTLSIVEEIVIDHLDWGDPKREDDLTCRRRIWRYAGSKKHLYKSDALCEFPVIYRTYKPLTGDN